jgi:putative transposase
MEEITNQANNSLCKTCDSIHVRKYGLYKGVQQYFCNDCGSKFKNTDTTFHMKTPTNEVSSALNAYYEGMPISPIRRHLLQEHQHAPSTATIYEWIQKYTAYATDSAKGYRPKVGDTWIADETVLNVDGQDLWLWDIIDDKTRFLIATRLSRSRTTQDAQMLIDRAIKTAGKPPKLVLTDKLASYLDVNYGKGAEHRQGGIARVEDNTQKIERFHESLKQRTKVMKGLKNLESAHEFIEGWLVYYNYLRPHQALQDKTPAEVAGIVYPYKNWADIIRKHTPSVKIVTEHYPRTAIRLPESHVGRAPRRRAPRITPKTHKTNHPEGIYASDKLLSKRYFRGSKRIG